MNFFRKRNSVVDFTRMKNMPKVNNEIEIVDLSKEKTPEAVMDLANLARAETEVSRKPSLPITESLREARDKKEKLRAIFNEMRLKIDDSEYKLRNMEQKMHEMEKRIRDLER